MKNKVIFENNQVVITVTKNGGDLQIKSKKHPMIQMEVMMSSHHMCASVRDGDHKVMTDQNPIGASVAIRTLGSTER